MDQSETYRIFLVFTWIIFSMTPLYSHANISSCQGQSGTCTYCLPPLGPIRTHFGHRVEYNKLKVMKYVSGALWSTGRLSWNSSFVVCKTRIRLSMSILYRDTVREWLWWLDHPFLLPFLTLSPCSQLYLQATSFGVSRSIVWLQSRRDAAIERNRGGSTNAALASARRDDQYEFRLGRIKHERVKVREGRKGIEAKRLNHSIVDLS